MEDKHEINRFLAGQEENQLTQQKKLSATAHKISHTANLSSRLESKPILWVVSRTGSLFLDLGIMLFSDQAWLTSNRKVNNQNNTH
jgi:hypothetical protein